MLSEFPNFPPVMPAGFVMLRRYYRVPLRFHAVFGHHQTSACGRGMLGGFHTSPTNYLLTRARVLDISCRDLSRSCRIFSRFPVSQTNSVRSDLWGL